MLRHHFGVMAKLLVVDDDAEMLEVCADILRFEGHDVRIARNGEEGMQRLAERLPELIVCDVEMPVLDGPHMVNRMILENAGKEKIPIFLASGVRDLRSVAEQVGTPYFLAKPFSVRAFLAGVGRALAERTPPNWRGD